MTALLSLWLAATATASTLGSPVARDEHGDVRVAIGLFGESAPGNPPSLPGKVLRVDWVPVDNFGLFVDGTWTNSQIDKVGGIRLRSWQAAAGGRLAVYPFTAVGFGLVGRVSYSHDWTVSPFYLQSSEDLITATTGTPVATTPQDTTDTTDTASEEESTAKDPFFPAWARGYREDETRRLTGRVVAAMLMGVPDSSIYLWFGPHLTVRGGQAITADGNQPAWEFEFNTKRPVGATLGFEAHSEDLLGVGDPRQRWLSAGMELHLIDATGLSVWVGYAF
jgi:hypothetical protein